MSDEKRPERPLNEGYRPEPVKKGYQPSNAPPTRPAPPANMQSGLNKPKK